MRISHRWLLQHYWYKFSVLLIFKYHCMGDGWQYCYWYKFKPINGVETQIVMNGYRQTGYLPPRPSPTYSETHHIYIGCQKSCVFYYMMWHMCSYTLPPHTPTPTYRGAHHIFVGCQKVLCILLHERIHVFVHPTYPNPKLWRIVKHSTFK